MTLTPDTRVIVNIWLPRVNGQDSSASSFIKTHVNNKLDGNTSRIGHVSLQTPNKYAGWWPNQQNANEVGVFNVVRAENSTYDDDCRAEDGAPDIRVALYSLDVNEIEDCFNNIEQCPYGYVLAGDKAITRLVNDEKGQSCCGLAYELLVAGKVLTLSSIFKDIKAKWVVVTPDNFSDFIKNAKATEWKKYPETHGFDRLPNEYTPQPAPPPSKMCLIL